MLHFLSSLSSTNLWLVFLAENIAISCIALLLGWFILISIKAPFKAASVTEWLIFGATNVINTAVTYFGFWLWTEHYIIFSFDLNWRIFTDLLVVFMLMDLCMFVFHYIIHNSSVYKAIHRFHHHYENPTPIDLFVLHPLETVSFGLLWLIIIALFNFNFFAVCAYLMINVAFGIIGHLGVEPFSEKLRSIPPFKYLGTSSFHHRHHLEIDRNYGFYTNIWDKLFKTYKP